MSDGERPIIEEVLDYALYAPLGIALTVVEDLPGLVRKGRSRVAGQVAVARFLGRMAAREARRRVDDVLTPDEPVSERQAPVPARVLEVRDVPNAAPSDVGESPELAISGYDTLAASQVVARLAGLDADALEAIRRHELSHRGRRTILARIDQLLEARRAH